MNPQAWNLDEDEFGATKPPKPRVAESDRSAGTPFHVLPEQLPLFAQQLLLHLLVAIALPVVLLVGILLYYSRYLPEIIVVSMPLGFAVGVSSYFSKYSAYEKDKRDPILQMLRLATEKPSPRLILASSLLPPAILFLGSVCVVWGCNRFIAVALPASIAAYLFYRFGHMPVTFFEQLLLAQPAMPPEAKDELRLPSCRPNIELFFGILVGIIAVPILVSTTVALMLLTLCLVVVYWPYLLPLAEAAPRGEAIRYLLAFAYRIPEWFVTYPDVYPTDRPDGDLNTWAPPFALSNRTKITVVLMCSLYLTLILGLSYYCPWEIFAKLSTNLPYDITNKPTTLTDYSWLFAPFIFFLSSNPMAVYLLTYVFGVLGFVVIPPAVLLAIYLPRIVELEELRQIVKEYRSSEKA